MDIKSAFLNELIQKEVYVEQPLGLESGTRFWKRKSGHNSILQKLWLSLF